MRSRVSNFYVLVHLGTKIIDIININYIYGLYYLFLDFLFCIEDKLVLLKMLLNINKQKLFKNLFFIILTIYSYRFLESYSKTKQKQSIGLNYYKRFPNAFKCKNEYNKWSKPYMSQSSDLFYNYSREAPKKLHNIRITRAVVIQFPIDKIDHYLYEIKWLYLSWLHMMKFEPTKWRTDLVIFVEYNQSLFETNNFVLNELKCSFNNVRRSPNDPPMCSLINYPAFSRRKIDFLNQNESLNSTYKYLFENTNIFETDPKEFEKFYKLMKREVNTYSYLDSILVGFEG